MPMQTCHEGMFQGVQCKVFESFSGSVNVLLTVNCWSNSNGDSHLNVDGVQVGEDITRGTARTFLVNGGKILVDAVQGGMLKGSYTISVTSL
jgi:hypothetical protein